MLPILIRLADLDSLGHRPRLPLLLVVAVTRAEGRILDQHDRRTAKLAQMSRMEQLVGEQQQNPSAHHGSVVPSQLRNAPDCSGVTLRTTASTRRAVSSGVATPARRATNRADNSVCVVPG